MKKEIIICFFIVIGIIIGDICLQKYTNNFLNDINYKLSEMKNSLDDENLNKDKIDEINKMCDEKFNVLTCFLEHDELEKIKTQLVIISSGVEMDDSDFVHEEIDRAIYLIKHIRDKQTLKLDNIF